MTTYGGRSAQYVPGRDVPNKEPPVSKFVVEKLYRVHRLRMTKIEPLVDCHVHVPDFLTNTTWKKNAEISRKAKIMSQNLHMYHRITKVANEESAYKKETKVHVRRIEHKASYLKKLKDQDRLHKSFKIQKENEYILKRIEKAQPEYTKKKMDEWYRHHELFKAGRRSDPTAGHIMTGMGDLLPPRLPPINSLTSSFDHASTTLTGSVYSPSRTAPAGPDGNAARMVHRSLQSNAMLSSSLTDSQRMAMPSGHMQGRYDDANAHMMQQSLTDGSLLTMQDLTAESSAVLPSHHQHQSSHQGQYRGESHRHHNHLERIDSEGVIAPPRESPSSMKPKASNKAKSPTHIPFASANAERAAQHGASPSKAPSHGPTHGSPHSYGGSPSRNLSRMNSSIEENLQDSNPGTGRRASVLGLGEDMNLLISRPFALPFESKNCLVQVYLSKTYDENIYLKVVTSGISPQVLCERPLQIDKAYEVVNAGGHSSHLIHGSDNEDLGTLSTLLINMFQDADDDGSGSLTFDEFQTLMEQVELGISPQELRFVISEADENENGVVDYEEFVPLAVDLIQSFRARNRAKTIYSQRDVEVDELIMKAISTKELEKVSNMCLEKIYEVDTKKYGLIRVPDLRRCLNGVAIAAGLKDNEISMICQMLPRDQFERCKYNTAPNNFLEILSKVRFMTMKNAMIEQQGSGLQKYLLDLCREEEARIASDGHGKVNKDSHAVTGKIPFRALINILTNSSRLSLSRLQVLVIMSEAHVQEGMINYFQFVPVVAKAIEIMFEPKALRQRAELIEKTDLSPEALLQGMQSDMFEQRLMTLFKSYDIDKSGNLDQNEFIACLESLDLQLSYAEMVALMASADVDRTGALSFADFMGFFTHNLLNLERERHVRLMQSSMQSTSRPGETSGPDSPTTANHLSSEVTNEEQSEFIDHLTNVFKLSDIYASGKIPFDEFENVLKTFNVIASKYLLDVMLSELHVDEHGLVEYAEAVSSCGELLKVYRAKECALEEHHRKEDWANEKAEEIVRSHEADILHIVNFLKIKIRRINESVVDPVMKYNEFVNLFRSPASGLARFEANRLINKLLTVNGPSVSNTESGEDHTGNTTSTTSSTGVTPKGASQHHGQHSHVAKAAMSPSHNGGSSTLPTGTASSKSSKQYRSHFTTQELTDAVYEVRKISVMRGLMEEIDGSTTRSTILAALNAEAKRLKKQGSLTEESTYMPVKACFKVLESLHDLRLNRSQILFIISWAECFDKDGNELDVEKFAEHAASIVSKLSVKEMMETRAEVVTQGSIDEKKVLNGMRENELEMHLEYALTSLNAENDMITPEQLRDVLKEIPRLNLSERDCTALIVPFDHSHIESGVFDWKDHLHSIVSMIITHCRERLIHRRVSLHATSAGSDSSRPMSAAASALHEEAKNQLKQLADKLLNFVKIQMVGDNMVIHLPMDNEKRRASQLGFTDEFSAAQNLVPSVLYHGVRWIEWHCSHAVVKPVTPAPRNSVLRGSVSVPGRSEHRMSSGAIQPLAGSMTSMTASSHNSSMHSLALLSPHAGGTATAPQHQVHYEVVSTKRVPVLVSITPGESGPMQVATSLFCNIISADASIRLSCPLPVKMPSIGVVDREAARQFAGNVVDKMYVEEVIGHNPELKMRE